MKKVLGIVLAVVFSLLLFCGVFAIVFWAAYTRTHSIWFSFLLGFVPFAGTAIIVSVLLLIVHLLDD